MKKIHSIISICCALLMMPLLVIASNDTINTTYPNTFLWKVEKQGQPTSYLLGTLHLGINNDTLPAPVLAAFSQTDALMTESDLLPDQNTLMSIGSKMIELDPTKGLSTKLSSETLNKLAALLGEQYPRQAMEITKPWALLTCIMYAKPEGYSEQFGVDMLLTQHAVETNKKRLALESMEQVITLFSSLPEDKVISFINVILDHLEEIKGDTLKMITFYHNNQVNELVAMISDKEASLKYFPKQDHSFWENWIYNDLLNRRNTLWLPVLKQQLPKESTFVAVGAAHLFGDNSLISALEKEGYTITPVMP